LDFRLKFCYHSLTKESSGNNVESIHYNVVKNQVGKRDMKNILILLLSIFIVGCSVHYGKRVPGFKPGYVDEQLGESTYQVKIGEAWPKDWPDLEKLAIYRAAEVTQSKSKRYFAVLNASTQINSYTLNLPTTTSMTGSAKIYGNTADINTTSITSGGGTSTISGGWYVLDYKVIDDKDIQSYKDVVDSTKVIRDLKLFIEKRR
jgi:hypothetical protein